MRALLHARLAGSLFLLVTATAGGGGVLAAACSSDDPATPAPDAGLGVDTGTSSGGSSGNADGGSSGTPSDGVMVYSDDNSDCWISDIAPGATPRLLGKSCDVEGVDVTRKLVTYERQIDNDNGSIRIVGIDGAGDREIAAVTTDKDAGGRYGDPVPAANGNAYLIDRGSNIGIVPLAGGSVQKWAASPSTSCSLFRLAISPDRTKLAWAAKDDCASDEKGIYVTGVDATSPPLPVAPENVFFDTVPALGVTFTPDGKKIAFIATDSSGPALHTMDFDGTNTAILHRLPADAVSAQTLHLSADGRFAYVFLKGAGYRRVKLQPLGTAFENVPALPEKVSGLVLVD